MIWEIFKTFFKVGLFTIGGGYAMLPILKKEFIKNCWMTDGECLDVISLTTSLPGPIVVNAATFMGYKMKGISGAFAAVAGAITPSVVVITLIASVFSTITDNAYVQYFFDGVRPGVCALLLYTIVSLSKSANLQEWENAALAVGTLVSLALLGIHQIIAIVAAAIIGIIIYRKDTSEEAEVKDESGS